MNNRNIECEIFAEHLLNFIKCRYTYPCQQGPLFPVHLKRVSPLTKTLKIATLIHLRNLEIEVRNIFNFLVEHGNLNIHFRDFSKDMAKVVCSRPFNGKELMQFCVIISRLAVLCYNINFRECIEHAITAIVEVLSHFHITGDFAEDGWRKMAK